MQSPNEAKQAPRTQKSPNHPAMSHASTTTLIHREETQAQSRHNEQPTLLRAAGVTSLRQPRF